MNDLGTISRARIAPLCVFALGAIAASSAAACPVASDLETGIRFTAPDGTYELHRRLDAERVSVDYVDPTAPDISRSIVIHGTYVQWYGSIDAAGQIIDGSGATTGRPMQPAQMPVPEAGLEWVTTQVFADSAGSLEETLRATVGQPFTWALGECAYEALPVTMVIWTGNSADVAGGNGYIERVTFLPALGTGVLTGWEDSEGASDYSYVSIAIEGGN